MARRRSRFKTVLVIGVLALACVGGWTLWDAHGDAVKSGISKAERAYKTAKHELVRHNMRKGQ